MALLNYSALDNLNIYKVTRWKMKKWAWKLIVLIRHLTMWQPPPFIGFDEDEDGKVFPFIYWKADDEEEEENFSWWFYSQAVPSSMLLTRTWLGHHWWYVCWRIQRTIHRFLIGGGFDGRNS